MSIANDVFSYISSQPPSRRQSLTSTDVAKATGYNLQKVSKAMWSLENSGKIDLVRAGHSIVGVKDVAGRPTPLTKPERHEAPSIRTPRLDEYERAKESAVRMAAQDSDNPYIEVRFRSNEIAEECIRMKQSLVRLEQQYRDLSRDYKVVLYEYEGFKQRRQAK